MVLKHTINQLGTLEHLVGLSFYCWATRWHQVREFLEGVREGLLVTTELIFNYPDILPKIYVWKKEAIIFKAGFNVHYFESTLGHSTS